MNSSRKRSAIEASALLALLFVTSVAGAASIGKVTALDGILLVTRASGSVNVLGVDSAIEQGDILSSRKQTYVTLTLEDNSSVTLGPDTDLKVERYVFDKQTPHDDGALFALAHGNVRITAGLLGTRSGDTFTLATLTATIDIRGASLIAEYVVPDRAKLAWRDTGPRDSRLQNMVAVSYAPAADAGFARTVNHPDTLRLALTTPVPGAKSPGLYVQVLDGMIHLTNGGGTQNFTAGQFGYTASFVQPPVVLPANPGMQFTPPPVFSSATGPAGNSTGTKAAAVDCQVR